MPRRQLSDHATWRDIPRCLLTFFIFAMVFIAFRAEGIHSLGEICGVMLNGSWQLVPDCWDCIYYIVPFFLIEWLGRRQEFPIQRLPMPTVLRWTVYWGLLLGIAMASLDRGTQFIYFQF